VKTTFIFIAMQITDSFTYVLNSNQKSSSPILCFQSCVSKQEKLFMV